MMVLNSQVVLFPPCGSWVRCLGWQVKRDADAFKSGALSESAEQAGEDAEEESEEDESLTQDVSDRVAQTITGLVTGRFASSEGPLSQAAK